MDSILEPLDRLTESLQWFVRHDELRLLQVVTSSSLRLAALERIAMAEHHSANQRPFFFLEAPTEPGFDGWDDRCEELQESLNELRELAPGGAIATLPSGGPTLHSLGRFGAELHATDQVLISPLEGCVVVLAPVWVTDAKRWVKDVEALVQRPELGRVRWIVVDQDEGVSDRIRERLSEAADVCDARMDEAASQGEADAQLEAMASAPAGADGQRLAGAAGPDVIPPARIGRPRPTDEDKRRAAREAGIPEVWMVGDLPHRMRAAILEAAQAQRKGDPVAAVRKQQEAVRLAQEAGMPEEALRMELMLAAYLLQGGAAERARTLLADVRGRAEQQGYAGIAVQAQLALGAALLVVGQMDEAPIAYAEAGQLAAKNGHTVLAIEGYRMAGQLLAGQKKTEQAGRVWQRALDIAEAAPSEERASSSAPDVARSLAALCRKHGLTDQAEALEAQAEALKRPPDVGGEGETAERSAHTVSTPERSER